MYSLKKILVAASILVSGMFISGAAQAQATTGNIAVGATKGFTSAGDCVNAGVQNIRDAFTVSLSNGVVASYDCLTVVVGVATANQNGRGVYFMGNTGGGKTGTYASTNTGGTGGGTTAITYNASLKWTTDPTATISAAVQAFILSVRTSGAGGGGT